MISVEKIHAQKNVELSDREKLSFSLGAHVNPVGAPEVLGGMR